MVFRPTEKQPLYGSHSGQLINSSLSPINQNLASTRTPSKINKPKVMQPLIGSHTQELLNIKLDPVNQPLVGAHSGEYLNSKFIETNWVDDVKNIAFFLIFLIFFNWFFGERNTYYLLLTVLFGVFVINANEFFQ